MDFLVQIGDKITITSQFEIAMDFIRGELAYWNNFTPEQPVNILVKKIPSDTSTISVDVKDDVNAEDIFGRS